MRNLSFLIIGAFMFISSCDRSGVFEQNLLIPDEVWSVDNIATFSVEITDTVSSHNIYTNIRNTTNYPNSNLFLFVTTQAPTGAILRDTVECFLADSKGDWLGKGFGRIRDNQILYKRRVRFPSQGTYRFEIQHGMRTSNLKEIASIGLRIEKAD